MDHREEERGLDKRHRRMLEVSDQVPLFVILPGGGAGAEHGEESGGPGQKSGSSGRQVSLSPLPLRSNRLTPWKGSQGEREGDRPTPGHQHQLSRVSVCKHGCSMC
eukprot:761711-Hanusia_phi.AAC.2